MKNPLNDKEFLLELDNYKNKIIYARIISLTIDELPQEIITGKVTGGSINIDGASAVRRTCSLTLIANDINLHSFYWGLSTKFKLEIGVENHINSNYPDIIWFKQGIYIITSFSTSQNTNSYNISISGKDKMALLNGEQGGTLTALSYDFGQEDIRHDDGYIQTVKIPLKQIIRNVVGELGGELPHNIVINNLDDYGLELLEYNISNQPLYILFNKDGLVKNVYINGNVKVYYEGQSKAIKMSNLTDQADFQFYSLYKTVNNDKATPIAISSKRKYNYYLAVANKGEAVGYRLTDLTYAGDLIGNLGESLTSILDKIKKQLGDFEYFYDLDGRFIFQRTKQYVNVSWTPIVEIEGTTTKVQFVTPQQTSSPIAYNFSGNKLLTSMSNNPLLSDLKNDYTVWGTRTSTLGNEIPIHMRYAIDKKPTSYRRIAVTEEMVADYNRVNNANLQPQSAYTFSIEKYDWRELIYRMALDYRKYHNIDDFEYYIAKENPQYEKGITGYEDYYIDMEGFWRQLYNPSKNAGSNYYTKKDGDKKYWHKNVIENPGAINFWIDFFDNDSELSKYSVPAIGRRQKTTNDSNVKSLYFKQVPLIIFYEKDEDKNKKTGYTYFKLVDGIDKYMTISSQRKSASEEIDAQFYQSAVVAEGISLTSIPIYYLEPNCKIFVQDDQNLNINGEYVATKFSIPLTYNGTMSITASKVINDF